METVGWHQGGTAPREGRDARRKGMPQAGEMMAKHSPLSTLYLINSLMAAKMGLRLLKRWSKPSKYWKWWQVG